MNQNNKYHVLPVTGEQIREGILFHITDALSDASSRSIQAARAAGRRGDLVEMLVGFENTSTNSTFYDQYGSDVMDVLYMNDAARTVLESSGMKLNFTKTADTFPGGLGTMARMYLVQ